MGTLVAGMEPVITMGDPRQDAGMAPLLIAGCRLPVSPALVR